MWKFIGWLSGIMATAAGAALLIMFGLISSSLFGALGGFLVDHPRVFDGEVAATLTVYGLPFVPLWKVGATLGFLSSALPKLITTTKISTSS